MKKSIFKGFVFVLVLVLLAWTVFASAKPKKVEEKPTRLKRILYTAEFKSDNGERKVVVEYEERYGKGNAHYIIKDKNNKLLRDFYSDVAPYAVIILNNKDRLIVWGGDWSQFPICNELVFFDFKGNIIKKYSKFGIGMPTLSRSKIDIDKSEKYFVIGYFTGNLDPSKGKTDDSRSLGIFSLKSGEIVRSIPLKKIGIKSEDSLAISDNANWILIEGETGKDWDTKVVLLNKKLKSKWHKDYPGKDFRAKSVIVKSISKDGSRFYLQEIGKNNRKTILVYKNLKGKIKLEKREVLKNDKKSVQKNEK